MEEDIIQQLLDEINKEPWYIKLRRWINLQRWLLVCETRKFWDQSFNGYIFRKK